MSFSIDDYTLPPIRCYSDAKLFWEKTKPWRGDSDTNTRPLSGRKRNQTIRQLNDGSFACRLHSTDVVTYHPNGDVTLQAYPSVSTDAFANRLTPDGVNANFNNAAGYVVGLAQLTEYTDCRYYLMEPNYNRLTIRVNRTGGWLPVDTNAVRPFNKYRLNIYKKNSAFKAYDVTGFKTWLKARETMGNPVRGYYWVHNADHHSILSRLANDEQWEGIYQEFGRDSMNAVRNAIYKIEDCIIVDRMPFAGSWDTVKSIVTSVRKYAHLASKGI